MPPIDNNRHNGSRNRSYKPKPTEQLHASKNAFQYTMKQEKTSAAESSVGANFRHDPSFGNVTRHQKALRIMDECLGFTIERQPSRIPDGGLGVCVTNGTVPEGVTVALYPGVVYYPSEPILLQSVRNQFIFRCIDGIMVDGNDKGISKFMFKSCAGRDRLGPYEFCDVSWLTPRPYNPMAVGQYVNNHNKDYAANVAYQEVNLPADFPLRLRQYVPNVFYSPQLSDVPRHLRLVALVSTRTIHKGEELFSSYYTVVH